MTCACSSGVCSFVPKLTPSPAIPCLCFRACAICVTASLLIFPVSLTRRMYHACCGRLDRLHLLPPEGTLPHPNQLPSESRCPPPLPSQFLSLSSAPRQCTPPSSTVHSSPDNPVPLVRPLAVVLRSWGASQARRRRARRDRSPLMTIRPSWDHLAECIVNRQEV
jgi:hypothetical protein